MLCGSNLSKKLVQRLISLVTLLSFCGESVNGQERPQRMGAFVELDEARSSFISSVAAM